MGHASPKTTMETYAHIINKPLGRAQVARALEAAYGAGLEAGRGAPGQVVEPGRVLAGSPGQKALPSGSEPD